VQFTSAMTEQEPSSTTASKNALLEAGFRLFFPGAGLFSIATITLWSALYFGNISIQFDVITPFQWHAHEMVFGYTMAVIAGFLLTAVQNWTGIRTAHGSYLMFIFTLWVAARIAFALGSKFMLVAAVMDSLFAVLIIVAISKPIFRTRNWRQLAIVSKLLIIGVFNILFYLSALQIMDIRIDLSIYGGFYLIIGLILTMARRVVPMFIQNGAGYPVVVKNSVWLDRASLILFLGFFVAELMNTMQGLSSALALLLFLINATRLLGWHTPGIWKKSLLWGLYLSLWFICLGFLLMAAVYVTAISKYLAIHAFAFGGIGMITMSMMSRVAWGHTGRNINQPPRLVQFALALLLAGAVMRVIFPLFSMTMYSTWIGISQVLWVIAFAVFTIGYLPVFLRPRIDS